MSIRLEMLQVARVAPKALGDSADLVRAFLLSQQNDDGGWRDRSGLSDLYYTVFGLEGLLALRADIRLAHVARYLASHGVGENLDFVHLCCLARCWAALANQDAAILRERPASFTTRVAQRLEQFRATDGGYHPLPASQFGTAYGCFLALAAYQDLGVELPEPLRVVQCLKFLETPDGAWTNERGMKFGATNSTAAAITLLRHLHLPIHPQVGDWLMAQMHADGGFLAIPGAPIPDLLTTATALHALSGLEIPLEPIKEKSLDFIDTLWTAQGSFHGNWTDEHLDSEYTYYGLLALGHLSL
jgi:prenyltransferase beta subunit